MSPRAAAVSQAGSARRQAGTPRLEFDIGTFIGPDQVNEGEQGACDLADHVVDVLTFRGQCLPHDYPIDQRTSPVSPDDRRIA